MIDDYQSYELIVGDDVHPIDSIRLDKKKKRKKMIEFTPTARSVNEIDIFRLSWRSLKIKTKSNKRKKIFEWNKSFLFFLLTVLEKLHQQLDLLIHFS